MFLFRRDEFVCFSSIQCFRKCLLDMGLLIFGEDAIVRCFLKNHGNYQVPQKMMAHVPLTYCKYSCFSLSCMQVLSLPEACKSTHAYMHKITLNHFVCCNILLYMMYMPVFRIVTSPSKGRKGRKAPKRSFGKKEASREEKNPWCAVCSTPVALGVAFVLVDRPKRPS